MKDAISKVNEKYNGRVTLELNDQYYNMKEKVEPVKFIVDIAEEAMKECDYNSNNSTNKRWYRWS